MIAGLCAISDWFLVSDAFFCFICTFFLQHIKYHSKLQDHTELQMAKCDPKTVTTIAKLWLYIYN